MKTCRDCKQELSLDSFSKDNSKKDKLSLYCRTCVAQRNLKFYERNPGYVREYYLTNKIAIQERIEQWNEKNKGKVKSYWQKYFNENRERISARRRELYALRKRANVG
jgi:hypothetical protein